MNGVDSVETLVINQRRDANTTAVETTIKNAEVIFFAGGNQCDYTSYYQGTKVESAVQSVYTRGGGVGGTSAGTVIQGDFVYDSCTGSVTSEQALSNPYDNRISFTYDFFHWLNLENTLTDTHFVTRDRMGRTMAFVARQIQDGKSPSTLGIAVNEVTSVIIDKNGLASVLGDGPAYFVLGDHPPETCRRNNPLTFTNYKIWKVLPGETFNLNNRPITGYYERSVINGRIQGNAYQP